MIKTIASFREKKEDQSMKNSTRLFFIGVLSTALIAVLTAVTAIAQNPVKFKVRIENISSPDGQTASNGVKWPFALSPGVWLVHGSNAPIFTTGKHDRGKGLEAQSEDGNPGVLAESLKKQPGVRSSGVFNTPVGAKAPGAIGPGGAYEFTFRATPGSKLSFTMMFGQSNDLYYAPNDTGIALFDKKANRLAATLLQRFRSGTRVRK
jgi:hypothetical protein